MTTRRHRLLLRGADRAAFSTVLVVAAACGGGAPQTGGTTAGGTETGGPRTAEGAAVTERAQSAWVAANESFARHEADGWNPSACDSVANQFEQAVSAQNGNFAEAVYMIGLVRLRCNQSEPATAAFTRALQQNERLCKARVALGLEYLRTSREQQALEAFQLAYRNDTACTEAYVNTAMIQRARGGDQVAEALNNLRRALAIDSQYLPAFNEMALLLYEQSAHDPQRLDLAGLVCRQAQLLNANYAPIYNTWGLIYMRQGNIIEALRAFQKAIELDNTNFEAHMNFGQITLGFRGYEDAQRSFTRALELRPRDYDATIGLGIALRGLNQAEAAQARYEEARSIDAARPESYFNLGVLYNDFMGGQEAQLTQAKEFFQQFVQRAGNQPRYAEMVTGVNRRCNLDRNQIRRRRRGQAWACRPGRLQNIDVTIELMREATTMAAQAAELERRAAEAQRQQEEAERQQQQQQQQPNPGATPDGGTPPAGGGGAAPAAGATPATP